MGHVQSREGKGRCPKTSIWRSRRDGVKCDGRASEGTGRTPPSKGEKGPNLGWRKERHEAMLLGL